MKSPIKFFRSENDHFSEKIFRKKRHQSSNILMFAIFFDYYNRCHQSINWNAIEILIKINPAKAVKLNFQHIFFKKWFSDFKKLMGEIFGAPWADCKKIIGKKFYLINYRGAGEDWLNNFALTKQFLPPVFLTLTPFFLHCSW